MGCNEETARKTDSVDVREERNGNGLLLGGSLSWSSLNSWPRRFNSNTSRKASTVTTQNSSFSNRKDNDGSDVEPPNSNNTLSLIMKRLGTMYPVNANDANLDKETRPPENNIVIPHMLNAVLSSPAAADSSTASQPTQRQPNNNTRGQPRSILKNAREYPDTINDNLIVTEEATKPTTSYLLQLMKTPDFFSGDDRLNLGLEEVERSLVVNSESKDEGKDGEEELLFDYNAAFEAKKEATHLTRSYSEPTSHLVPSLVYKPMRALSSDRFKFEDISGKRHVRHEPERNQDWDRPSHDLKKKPLSHDNRNAFRSTLKQHVIFPSTATNKDTGKSHVRHRFEPIKDWGITPSNSLATFSRSSKPPLSYGEVEDIKHRDASQVLPLQAVEPVVNFFTNIKKNGLIPSTDTLSGADKRHTHHRSEPNQEWDIEPPISISSSSSEPSFDCISSGTFRDASNRCLRFRQPDQTGDVAQIDGKLPKTQGSEQEERGNIFQRYMKNKAKFGREMQQQQKLGKNRGEPLKGELLVDWGDQGTDSEDDGYDQDFQQLYENIIPSRRVSDLVRTKKKRHGNIIIVNNDSSRRISDITMTEDDFSDSDNDLDASFEMRERIRALSIAEEDPNDDEFFISGVVEDEEIVHVRRILLKRQNSNDTSASCETVRTSGRNGDHVSETCQS